MKRAARACFNAVDAAAKTTTSASRSRATNSIAGFPRAPIVDRLGERNLPERQRQDARRALGRTKPIGRARSAGPLGDLVLDQDAERALHRAGRGVPLRRLKPDHERAEAIGPLDGEAVKGGDEAGAAIGGPRETARVHEDDAGV